MPPTMRRVLSTLPPTSSRMRAWLLNDYGVPLELHDNVRIPVIRSPDDVLVRVSACSANAIDARMADGYGRVYINALRNVANMRMPTSPTRMDDGFELPLILGRDFSGTVVDVGRNVRKFKAGDDVMGVVTAEHPGCFADYTMAKQDWIVPKPSKLSHTHAAAIPYTLCTSWSALCTVARLNPQNARGANILLHGCTGGIGTTAAQLLRAWGANVTGTCSSASAEFATKYCQTVVDYEAPDAYEQLTEAGPFDVVLDPVDSALSRSTRELLGLWRNCVYVSIKTPLLGDGDSLGFPFGFARSASTFAFNALQSMASGGRWYAWAYFSPHREAMATVSQLVDQGSFMPALQRTVAFEELPLALKEVDVRKGRGKTVIQVQKES